MPVHKSSEQLIKALDHSGFAPCNEDNRYDVPGCSGICTEVETLTLMFGLVRMLRPALVVETGCNVGCMTQTIMQALLANGTGDMATCDTEVAHCTDTRTRCGVFPAISCCEGLVLVQRAPDADLYFLDSSDESRMAELEWLKSHGKSGAVVTVHDTNLYSHVRKVVESFPRYVLLGGPRGLGVITL